MSKKVQTFVVVGTKVSVLLLAALYLAFNETVAKESQERRKIMLSAKKSTGVMFVFFVFFFNDITSA